MFIKGFLLRIGITGSKESSLDHGKRKRGQDTIFFGWFGVVVVFWRGQKILGIVNLPALHV